MNQRLQRMMLLLLFICYKINKILLCEILKQIKFVLKNVPRSLNGI